MDNNEEIIEVLEEDEVVPDPGEVLTGALGRYPEGDSEDAFAKHFLRECNGALLWVHNTKSLAAYVNSRWTKNAGTSLLDGKISAFCERMAREMPPPKPRTRGRWTIEKNFCPHDTKVASAISFSDFWRNPGQRASTTSYLMRTLSSSQWHLVSDPMDRR